MSFFDLGKLPSKKSPRFSALDGPIGNTSQVLAFFLVLAHGRVRCTYIDTYFQSISRCSVLCAWSSELVCPKAYIPSFPSHAEHKKRAPRAVDWLTLTLATSKLVVHRLVLQRHSPVLVRWLSCRSGVDGNPPSKRHRHPRRVAAERVALLGRVSRLDCL